MESVLLHSWLESEIVGTGIYSKCKQ